MATAQDIYNKMTDKQRAAAQKKYGASEAFSSKIDTKAAPATTTGVKAPKPAVKKPIDVFQTDRDKNLAKDTPYSFEGAPKPQQEQPKPAPSKEPASGDWLYDKAPGVEEPTVEKQKIPKVEGAVTDADKEFVFGLDKLSADERAVYDQLTPAEKRQFEALGAGETMKQVKYLQEWKENKEYKEEQEKRRLGIQDIQTEIGDIQSTARIKNARDRVDALKQNIAYMGTMGRPGVSAQRLDAVKDQVLTAEKTYSDLVKVESLMKEAQKMGNESSAAAYARELELMQDELDNQVNGAVQEALNSFNSAELAGQMETVDDVNDMRMKLLEKLDNDIVGFTDANIKQRQFLYDRYDKIKDDMYQKIQDDRAYEMEAREIDMDMSTAQGYYTNKNGQPIMSMMTGQPIQVPQDPPLKPQFDENTGMFVSFGYDENGNIVANAQQVFDPGTTPMDSSMMLNVMQAISSGEMTPAQAKTLFPEMAGAIDAQGPAMAGVAQAGVPGEQVTVGGKTYTVPNESQVQEGQVFLSQYSDKQRGPRDGYCGQFVNDYIKSMGVANYNMFVDPISNKSQLVNSQEPTAGSVIIMDSQTEPDYGHVAVVESVNQDGTLNLKEANWNDDRLIHVRKNVDPNALGVKVHGYFDPRKGAPQVEDMGLEQKISEDPVYQQAQNILDGIGDYPSKNDKNYNNVVNAVGEIAKAKQETTDDSILKSIYGSSKYDKDVSDTTLTKVTDAFTVLGQVQDLTTQLENMEDDVGPIEGLLRGKNPYDVNAQAIAAQLNAIVPKVARGVFGEVGVLTDQDIERYMKTLPNTKMPADLSKIVSDLLKITTTKSLINTLGTQAKGRRNVSSFAGDYEMAKQFLDAKGISTNPFANYEGVGEDITPQVVQQPQVETQPQTYYIEGIGDWQYTEPTWKQPPQ